MKFEVYKNDIPTEVLALVTNEGKNLALLDQEGNSIMFSEISDRPYKGSYNFADWVKLNPSGIKLYKDDTITITL